MSNDYKINIIYLTIIHHSELTKLCLCHNSVPMYQTFSQLATSIPQGAELFDLNCAPSDIAAMFLNKFSAATIGDLPKLADILGNAEAVEVLDELSLEESKFYQAKVGKYMKTTLRNIEYAPFWWTIFAANMSRAPLLHFYASLCKISKEAEPAESFPIVALIVNIIPSIHLEFQHMLETFEEWTEDAWNYAHISRADVVQQDADAMMSAAIALVLFNAAAFNRRVASVYAKQGVSVSQRVFNRSIVIVIVISYITINDFEPILNHGTMDLGSS